MSIATDIAALLLSFAAGNPLSVAYLGDSTGMGYGSNPTPANAWTNGRVYAFSNNAVNPNNIGDNWYAGNAYSLEPTLPGYAGQITQVAQDNVLIPSDVRLLRTWMESINPANKVYNYSISGGTAATHIIFDSVGRAALQTPKPSIVLISLGINSVKSGNTMINELTALADDCIANGMLPMFVHEANPGMDSRTGTWWGLGGPPSNYSEPTYWVPMTGWSAYRTAVEVLAASIGTVVVDAGTPDGAIDLTLLYDPYHPSAEGYQVIFESLQEFFNPTPPPPPEPVPVVITPRILSATGYRPGRVYLKDVDGFRRVNAEVLT